MKVIKPRHDILTPISNCGLEELVDIEQVARTCYKSFPKLREGETTTDCTKRFIKGLIDNHHEAMLEHGVISVRFVCDRGVSHELVRHRMAAFAQESTRWCNYSAQKFGGELYFIEPYFLRGNDDLKKGEGLERWMAAMMQCENSYMKMIELGFTPQEARSVLPNSLKTELVVTANYREWRHILKLRCAKDAHPQMKELMIPLLLELKNRIPVIFNDIDADWEWYKNYMGYDEIEVFPNYVHLYNKGDADDPTRQKTHSTMEVIDNEKA